MISMLLISLGCDKEAAPEAPVEGTQEEATEGAATQPEEVSEVEKVAKPRAIETKTPADDLIGVLPDGVGLAVGESIPKVEAKDAEGNDVELATIAEGKTMLLVFYRGGWCPFCNFQLRELTQAHAEFARRGILPVAISVDRVEEAARTQASYTVPFPVLSDPDLAVHKGFGVVQEVSAEEVERLRGMGLDLKAASGREHHTVAVPGIFLVDSQGVVRWAHANVDYRVRPSNEQLLKAIDAVDLSAERDQ